MLIETQLPLFLKGIKMLTKARVVQLTVMLIVLLVAFFWRTFDTGHEKPLFEEAEITAVESFGGCDYKEACEFITEQGKFLLNIPNLPIKAEQWIEFELMVPTKGITVSKAQIIGKSMFMGVIPVSFSQLDELRLTSQALVGACMHDEMVWTLEITVEKEGVQQQLTFDFMIKH